jgi:hypothetical protein
MKSVKLLAILLLMGLATFTRAQADVSAIDKYFQQYVEDERFTVVYISSKLLGMFEQLDIETDMDDGETQAIMELAKDIKGIRILVAEENAAGFYEEAKQKIDTKEYEVLMTVRNKGEENVDFLIKEDNELINELLLLVGGQDEFVLLSFVGKVDMEKISRLINEFDDGEAPDTNEDER